MPQPARGSRNQRVYWLRLCSRGWHNFCLSQPVTIGRFPAATGRAPERRSHHRVLSGAAAWLVVDGERISAECVNVSMGGAAVLVEALPPVGSVIWFELSLGMDRGSIAIQCEVVRSSPDLGLRFMALDRRSLEAILSLL